MELIFSTDPSILNLAIGIFILFGLLAYVYFSDPGLFSFSLGDVRSQYISEEDAEVVIVQRSNSHEVFLEYDHTNVEAWATWIRLQDQRKQEQAFNRLAEYLQKPIKELGIITTEVVRGLELLKHPFTYALLVDFIHLVRSTWGANSSAEMFYDSSLRALVGLNSGQAELVLTRELQELSMLEESEALKEIVVRAATNLPMTESLAETLSTFLVQSEHKLETRKVVISQLDLRPATERKIFLVKTFENYISNFAVHQISFENSQVLRSLFERTRKFVAAGDRELWTVILQAVRVRYLQMDMVELMSNLLADSEMTFKPWQILGLIRLPGELRKRFGEAICKRFYMTELEKSVILEPVLSDEYPFEPNIIVVEKMKREMFIPDFMELWASAFSTILIRKRNPRSAGGNPVTGMALIAGDGEPEKLYVARAVAANTNRSFIYVDAHRIAAFPEKVSELQKIILNARPCVIYVAQGEEILTSLAQGKENQRYKDFIYTLKKLSTNPNISVIASVAQGEHEAKRKYGTMFCLAYELMQTGSDLRESMFRSYQQRLLERRSAKMINPHELLESFAKQTTIQFASALHRYIKTSLMCFGQMVPFSDYERLIQELPVEEPETLDFTEDEVARVDINIATESGNGDSAFVVDSANT